MLKKIILLILLLVLVHTISGFSQSQSDSALIRRPVFKNPLVWKLTKSVANSLWGKDLYYYPYSEVQAYAMSPSYVLYSGMSFSIDHSWHRMLYSECLSDWIRAYGSYGASPGKFNFPRRVDVELPGDEYGCDPYCYYYIFVVDTENNRIVKLRCDYKGNYTIINDGAITGNGLDYPKDLDINNGYDFWPVDNDYLWVLNGNCQIKRFTYDGQLMKTYGEYGSGVGQFNNPQAIACGRSDKLQPPYDKYANTTSIYVGDTGNNRVVWLIKEGPVGENIYWEGTWDAPAGSRIADLDVDNFGQVWVVDIENGRFFKLTYDLEPLATFGSEGTGINQFLNPISISNTGGYLGCGNVSVVEYYGEESGGQYFTIATDIVDFQVYSDNNHWSHYVAYVLVDPAGIYMKVYNQAGGLVKTVIPGVLYYSGSTLHWWDGKDNYSVTVPSGNYKIKVSAVSVYRDITQPGSPRADSVTREGWVCHVHFNDKSGDTDNDHDIDLADVINLANYVLNNPNAIIPNPIWKGDTQGNCNINLGDVIYLSNYLLKGGPSPVINFSCTNYGWNCR